MGQPELVFNPFNGKVLSADLSKDPQSWRKDDRQWLFNPWKGYPRTSDCVANDPQGLAIWEIEWGDKPSATEKPDAYGWITWAGGECPVNQGATVRVRLRDGAEGDEPASAVYWTHTGGLGDIVAYRLAHKVQDTKPDEPATICCGNYDACQQPCTPRGVHMGRKQAADEKPKPSAVQVLGWPALEQPSATRFYLAGPMSGLPEYNFPAFHAAAKALRAAGLDIVNPAELHPGATDWATCLRADIRELVTCQGIILMPGWENSRGARLEHHIATSLGMAILQFFNAQRPDHKPEARAAAGGKAY